MPRTGCIPTRIRRPLPLLLAGALLAIAGCGGEGERAQPTGPPATVAPTTAPPATVGAGGGRARETSCPPLTVPGHRASEILVTGASCEDVRPVVEAAAGRGRAAYATDGLRCTPSDAPGGDTDYLCSGAGVEVAFLYSAL